LTAKVLAGLNEEVNRLRLKQDHHFKITAELAWRAARLNFKLQSTARDWAEMTRKCHQRQVATQEIAALTGIEALAEIDPADASFLEVKRMGPQSTYMETLVRQADPDSEILRVSPFTVWENITGKARLMEYKGPELVLFNSSSNCLVSISLATTDYANCTRENYEDPNLSMWTESVKQTETELPPTIKSTAGYNYFYCFRHEITVENTTFGCPATAFGLPLDTSFKIPSLILGKVLTHGI